MVAIFPCIVVSLNAMWHSATLEFSTPLSEQMTLGQPKIMLSCEDCSKTAYLLIPPRFLTASR